jgi:ribosome-associated protein
LSGPEEAAGRPRSLLVAGEIEIPLAEIELRASRSSGPGGQHANVTASRVEASFDVLASRSLSDAQRARLLARSGPRVSAVAQDDRGQARNRQLALRRLERALSKALTVAPPRHATRPTAASRARRLQDKRHAAQRKAQRRRPPANDE